MASFRISNLKVTEVLDGSSFIPSTITQNSTFYDNGVEVTEPTTVTRKLSVQNLREWFDSGVYKQIRSGPSVKVTPENFTTSGVIEFHAPGFVALYPGSSDPEGWFICNGRSLSTSLYAELFSVIGYQYGGTGNTFKIPDFSGRSVFGLETMGVTAAGRITVDGANTPGTTAGSRQHTLSDSQTPLVSHTHAISGSFDVGAAPRRTGNNSSRNTGRPRREFNTTGGGCSITLSLTISSSSSPTSIPATLPHPNLPPFFLLNWIIKY